MRRLTTLLLLAAVAGCGPRPAPPTPLSVEEWKALPAERKYTNETLERLKVGDPKLDTPEGWAAFQRTLAEAKKKDFPRGTRR